MELKGKPVADYIKGETILEIEKLKQNNIVPKLAIIRLGDNPDDISYEKSILKYCETVGVEVDIHLKGAEILTKELVQLIERLNQDVLVHGILLFRPLPKQLDISIIANSISLDKDVDCMNKNNLLPIFLSKDGNYAPSTARGVMELLAYYDIELTGKNVVVLNRSEVVGKPLAMMLLNENATVTICHSKTEKLEEITKRADIVVTALGKAKLLDERYFNEKAIVIDVGMSLDDYNKISGDVDYDKVYHKVNAITPVPGGVGRITTSVLIKQLINNIKG